MGGCCHKLGAALKPGYGSFIVELRTANIIWFWSLIKYDQGFNSGL